jgi:hypothetical protein
VKILPVEVRFARGLSTGTAKIKEIHLKLLLTSGHRGVAGEWPGSGAGAAGAGARTFYRKPNPTHENPRDEFPACSF